MEARLARQGREIALLRAQIERYESALTGSNVTVFTQAQDANGALRYTSISNPMFGREIDSIVGHTDEDILPIRGRSEIAALKKRVLSGEGAVSQEVAVGNTDFTKWFDFHLAPLREDDEIVGLTCAAIDITRRKSNESHLRLVMRELTHRSKNLLAVIQAMARQSAKHAVDTEHFLDQFNARLYALAMSHDLLVRESWYGASLDELIRSQLGHHLQGAAPPVEVSGPEIVLKPDAAQSLGLALHELSTNAAKYGALSDAAGRIEISWCRPETLDVGVELSWVERGGPRVETPSRRGFGTLVIDHNLVRALNATVAIEYDPAGLRCKIAIPADQLLLSR
jgi:PAS domain S-box-containing protein